MAVADADLHARAAHAAVGRLSALAGHWRGGSLLTVSALVIVGVLLFVDPIPQWPEYHQFADDRTLLGIPNAQNVLSNLGLLLVGAWGVAFLAGPGGAGATGPLKTPYLVFFTGLALTGAGSAWYHLAPDNQSLVWDRLPMTVMFMGFFASVIGELAGPRASRAWLAPLVLAGGASVAWWAWTEAAGAGDLRAYGLVQFLPMMLIVAMLVIWPRPRPYAAYVVAMMLGYALAKVCEHFDREIFEALGLVSGHALKHLVSAAAAVPLLVMLQRRGRIRAP